MIDIKFIFLYYYIHVIKRNGCLAQLVEQWTVNPCVAGSKPAAAVRLLRK